VAQCQGHLKVTVYQCKCLDDIVWSKFFN